MKAGKIRVIRWERTETRQPAHKKDRNADFLGEHVQPASQIESDKRGTQKEKPL